tara:strand:- start:33 stop:437 length:405 start_codon:yes stop_codon:yes gene_type:complete
MGEKLFIKKKLTKLKINKMTNSNFYNHNIATEISELHDLGLMAFNDTDETTDVCDSIAFLSKDKSIKVKIFFPNAAITDTEQEMFNEFKVVVINCDFDQVFNSHLFNTWNEVLNYIIYISSKFRCFSDTYCKKE